jgi:CheY-like chemotaxis protein
MEASMARILIVEDDDAVRHFTQRAIAADGHFVETAVDGADGLDKLAADQIGFDLILSDIRMPVMDGIEMALEIAVADPEQKILFMTGYADQRERTAELDGTVIGVVAKPFTLREIRGAVNEAVLDEMAYAV